MGKKTTTTTNSASLAAGFISTVVTSPIDVVKTRFMNMKPVNGVNPYSGIFDCFAKTKRAEGYTGFYKGFFPNLMSVIRFTKKLISLFIKKNKPRQTKPNQTNKTGDWHRKPF